ncbi:uncharacterized protein LOC125656331 [Ostrea edulis]|uniref:uncharacterized protein LOC125656331 n=1 Tax=Ostrea edulis TaxID=37623 RepID=UPI0024AFA06F|nr:uncharacterized protein LOC125656331 [Ostrea edulis]
MTSSYESTPETTNANRACRVVLGPCTDGLRDLLRHYVPPHSFHHVIKQNKLNLPRLNRDQRDLILPRTGNYAGNYVDMDISLLYILLRNISSIPPQSNGWGNDPDPSDKSVSATIERIRLVRNRCVHSSDPSMSISDFHSIWSTIRSAMVDLDAFLMNGNKYEKDVDFLHRESMDPENDLHYEEELKKQVEEDKTTRKMMVSLKSMAILCNISFEFWKVEETAEETKKLHGKVVKLTESPIPPNVREQYDIEVQRWTEENKLYYETHSFPSVMQKVRNQPYVTFVGVPGSGKSATAHHIALKLQEEGYQVVPIDEIRELKQYCDTKNPQVFVIDDVVGVFGLQKTNLDVLTNYEKKITQPCMDKSRTLMTCREAVFNETLSYKPFLTKDENVIKLHSSYNALDDEDKKQILKKYGLKEDLISPELLTSTSHMFPLLCKLFSKETKFKALGPTFFLNPVQCIIDELDDMQRHNKLNYATLVLCMLNENSISKDILKDRKNEHFMNMKSDTLENCELENQTDAFKFVKALSAMEGTYTKQCGAHYTFIHDSMFEICAYQYGKQFPDKMLLYMSSSYIANYVKPQTIEPGIVNKMIEKQGDFQSSKGDKSSDDSDVKEKQSDSQSIERDRISDGKVKESGTQSSEGDESTNAIEGKRKESDDENDERKESFDLCIRLDEDQYPLLAERLYRDIQNMELYDVFRNEVLAHTQVCQAFIGVLETKSYTELKSVFLSSQGEVDKIVSKRGCVKEESDGSKETRELIEYWKQTVLLDKRDKGIQSNEYNVRVISWVILYGHYHILEYIVQQTGLHNEICELFEITGNSSHQSKSGIDTCIRQENENNRLIEKYRLLLLSCYSGDVQSVRLLLPVCKKAIDGSKDRPWFIYSPLGAACNAGHVSVVKELVKAGADVNLEHDFGITPLIAACEGGHVSVLEELMKAGADINQQNRLGDTPLIAACEGGHVSVVEELVKVTADLNICDVNGRTPLAAASMQGHVSVIQELMKVGADINLQDNDGNSPLKTASKAGHVSVVEELVKVGADVNLQDNGGNSPLKAASKAGHVSVVEELVKARADVNLQDNGGNSPLKAASKAGHVSVVEKLVKARADINLQDNDRNTPLTAACELGHVSVVVELVKADADVNLQDNVSYTPLIAACKGGHVSVVKELVKARADINLQDNDGNTPLTVACDGGHVSVVEELVTAGADINLQDNDGNTPLTVACYAGHESVVEVLVKAKADINQQNRWGCTPLRAACNVGHESVVEELVKAGADTNLRDNDGNTPLTVACMRGYVSIMEKLMKVGADINLQDNDGNTPLTVACEGHESVVEELVKAGADINLQDNDGNTPLTVACEGGHVGVVEDLVKAVADINLQNRWGYTPLRAACNAGHESVVEELVKAGADINLQDNDGNTPLTVACEGGHVGVVEDLVKAVADINLQNRWGYTPLRAACNAGHESVVEELVKAGADINLQDNDGNTPLTVACEGGHVSMVEKLVKAGADINLQDNDGNTPLTVACEGGHVSVVEELVKAGRRRALEHIHK